MAKNTNRVARLIAYVAALGLATGALATSHTHFNWDMNIVDADGDKGTNTFAKELFGAGATAVTLAEGTSVEVVLRLPANLTGANAPVDAQNNDIDERQDPAAGSTVKLTFTLDGAKFGQAVRWTDFTATADTAGTDNAIIKTGGQSGGERGDNSVSFEVTIDGTVTGGEWDLDSAGYATAATLAVNRTVSLKIGSLQAWGGGDVKVEVTAKVTSGPSANFPETVVFTEDNPDTDKTNEDSRVVATSVLAIKYGNVPGVKGLINLKKRTELTVAQLSLGALTATETEGDQMQANGKSDFTIASGGPGDIDISVGGSIEVGDVLFFDQNGNMKQDTKEGMTVKKGSATGRFRLGNAFDGENCGADATPGKCAVYFIPNGTDERKRGKFDTTFAVSYDDTTADSPGDQTTSSPLDYAGISPGGRAYAIPNPGMNDIGNVRIKCEHTQDCTVFLGCEEQDGTYHIGEVVVPGTEGGAIAAGATHVMQAEDIGEALGLDAWSGRLSCDVLSTGPNSVQVLVRSDGSLINNTYVSDGM